MKNFNLFYKLPNFMIVKTVINVNHCTSCFYFVTKLSSLNQKYLNKQNILSYHPLIIKDKQKFYHIKKINEEDFLLINFCFENDPDDLAINNLILENYFNQSTDL